MVFERDEVSSVAGSLPFDEASGTATDHRVILAKSHQRQARRSTVVEPTMDINEWLRKQLEAASPDLLRAMVQDFAEALMGAEADAVCGAPDGERSPARVNIRNGYRQRAWDTRVGTIALAIPKLRQGSYFPDWLLEPRRRAEQAFVSVIADAYLVRIYPNTKNKRPSLSTRTGSRSAASSPLHAPLHADLRRLAQPRRALVRRADDEVDQARQPPLRPRTRRLDPHLDRELERRPETLRLAQERR